MIESGHPGSELAGVGVHAGIVHACASTPRGVLYRSFEDDGDGSGSDGSLAPVTVLSGDFRYPSALAASAVGVYVCDTKAHCVRLIRPDGSMVDGAFCGMPGRAGYSEGRADLSLLNRPMGIAVADGAVFIGDTFNHRVRRVGTDGRCATLAGDGGRVHRDDPHGASAAFCFPCGLDVLANGAVAVADRDSHCIRLVDTSTPDNAVRTVAGSGVAGFSDSYQPFQAAIAQFKQPMDVASDGRGGFFVADSGNGRVRFVTADSAVFTVASGRRGEGRAHFEGMSSPRGVAVSAVAGDDVVRVYVADPTMRSTRPMHFAVQRSDLLPPHLRPLKEGKAMPPVVAAPARGSISTGLGASRTYDRDSIVAAK